MKHSTRVKYDTHPITHPFQIVKIWKIKNFFSYPFLVTVLITLFFLFMFFYWHFPLSLTLSFSPLCWSFPSYSPSFTFSFVIVHLLIHFPLIYPLSWLIDQSYYSTSLTRKKIPSFLKTTIKHVRQFVLWRDLKRVRRPMEKRGTYKLVL